MKWYKKQLAEKLKKIEENLSEEEKATNSAAQKSFGLKNKPTAQKAFLSPVAASKLSRPKTDGN